jgi:hypothetical protein
MAKNVDQPTRRGKPRKGRGDPDAARSQIDAKAVKQQPAFEEDAAPPRLVTLPLGEIFADPDVQPREKLNPATVADYSERMIAGDVFPPVDVFGDKHILASGYHRLEAAKLAKQPTLQCHVHKGGRREAMLFAVCSNKTHGLQRTNADKRRAVLALLKDAEWSKWASNEIAKRVAVSHTLVDNIRAELAKSLATAASERTVKTKHGKTTTMNISRIGRSAKSKPEPRGIPIAALAEAIQTSGAADHLCGDPDPAASAEARKKAYSEENTPIAETMPVGAAELHAAGTSAYAKLAADDLIRLDQHASKASPTAIARALRVKSDRVGEIAQLLAAVVAELRAVRIAH